MCAEMFSEFGYACASPPTVLWLARWPPGRRGLADVAGGGLTGGGGLTHRGGKAGHAGTEADPEQGSDRRSDAADSAVSNDHVRARRGEPVEEPADSGAGRAVRGHAFAPAAVVGIGHAHPYGLHRHHRAADDE